MWPRASSGKGILDAARGLGADELAASELEAQVLAAVADLVRAGVEDVVQLSGLSAVSATITLRALAARGKLIRAETPGGVEYSLP